MNPAFLQLNLAIQGLYGQSFEKRPDLDSLENIFRINQEISPEEDEPEIRLGEGDQNRALAIARGVYENRESLDNGIRKHLRGWKLERLGLLELLLLRVGMYLLTVERQPLENLLTTLGELASAYGLEPAISLIEGVLAASHREIHFSPAPDSSEQV